MRFKLFHFYLLIIGLTVVMQAAPQVPNIGIPRTSILSVYAGNFSRDETYFREQITFVNYVNEQSDADVVLNWSRQATGAGGGALTLTFIGQHAF
ncbi:hypothetical protein ACFLZR_01010, partial [Candidatus Neomarinimicrobiota bacterium]